jgi:2-methylcitrate dehydratase PrpD
VLSPRFEPSRLNDSFGRKWELMNNTFKPYPCGIVCHPAIDAAIAISSAVAGHLQDVASIEVRCHPLVHELTGNPRPVTGLQAKFSTIHAVAAGLCDGEVALAQYTDERVTAADVTRLRSLTTLIVEDERPRDAARVDVVFSDGRRVSEEIRHARGSFDRPLTPVELHDKVRRLIEPTLPGASTEIIEHVGALPEADTVESLLGSLRGGNVAPMTNEPLGMDA